MMNEDKGIDKMWKALKKLIFFNLVLILGFGGGYGFHWYRNYQAGYMDGYKTGVNDFQKDMEEFQIQRKELSELKTQVEKIVQHLERKE